MTNAVFVMVIIAPVQTVMVSPMVMLLKTIVKYVIMIQKMTVYRIVLVHGAAT